MPKIGGKSEFLKWREVNLMSQGDLAYAMKVSVRSVQYWESGKCSPSPKLMRKFEAVKRKFSNRKIEDLRKELAELERESK